MIAKRKFNKAAAAVTTALVLVGSAALMAPRPAQASMLDLTYTNTLTELCSGNLHPITLQAQLDTGDSGTSGFFTKDNVKSFSLFDGAKKLLDNTMGMFLGFIRMDKGKVNGWTFSTIGGNPGVDKTAFTSSSGFIPDSLVGIKYCPFDMTTATSCKDGQWNVASPVPEPATGALLLASLLGVVGIKRRSDRSNLYSRKKADHQPTV